MGLQSHDRNTSRALDIHDSMCTYGLRTRAAAGHTFQVLMLSGGCRDEGSLLGCSSEELQAGVFFGLGLRLGYFIAASFNAASQDLRWPRGGLCSPHCPHVQGHSLG